jgi:hypothetical protein
MNKTAISTIGKASLAIESGVITNEKGPIAIEVRAFWITNGAKGVEKGATASEKLNFVNAKARLEAAFGKSRINAETCKQKTDLG